MKLKNIIILVMLLLVGLTVVSASEVNDDTTNVETPTEETTEITEVSQQSGTDNNYNSNNNIGNEELLNDPPVQKTITPSSYSTDIQNIATYDIVTFDGVFTTFETNGLLTIPHDVNITSTTGSKFEDTRFVIASNNVVIENLTIENDDGTSGSVISTYGYNNIQLANNVITFTKTTAGETIGIKLNSTNTLNITNNTITINGYPQDRYDHTTWAYTIYNTALVVDNAYDVNITENRITATASTPTQSSGTNEGMNIRNAYDVKIEENNVTVSGGDYNYAITIENVYNSNTSYNKLISNSENYAAGLQLICVSDSKATHNVITATAHNTTLNPTSGEAIAYGIYLTNNYAPAVSNYNIVEYNDITVQSTIGYGIEGYLIDDNEIKYNNINVIGTKVMGIGLYNSSLNELEYNIISVMASYSDDLSYVYEQIPPETTGIKIVGGGNSSVNIVDYNTITVLDLLNPNTAYAVIVEADSNYVQENHLISNNALFQLLTGDNSVSNLGTDNEISRND
ncbi:MAG: hypothetical protein BZ136_08170 [Methanosphaera sp. rholeuAM74]|nr:MAG: hypothetical protein BZ136_08170 [Methanosphaera sp. rholeuAM74]